MLTRCLTIFFMLFVGVQTVQASLLITPKRIIFEPKITSETVTLVNTSNETKTYRLSLVDIVQKKGGGIYSNPTAEQLTLLDSAKEMVRFSPRQVTLAPGEAQKIRLGLKRTNATRTGEFRTHLMFSELPPPQLITSDAPESKIQIHILTSFTIPVFVRATKFNGVQVGMQNVLFVPNDKSPNGKPQIKLDLTKTGDFGVNGRVDVYWAAEKVDQYKPVGFITNVAIYRENNLLANNLINLEMSQLEKGYYKVVYKGGPFFDNQEFTSSYFEYK